MLTKIRSQEDYSDAPSNTVLINPFRQLENFKSVGYLARRIRNIDLTSRWA